MRSWTSPAGTLPAGALALWLAFWAGCGGAGGPGDGGLPDTGPDAAARDDDAPDAADLPGDLPGDPAPTDLPGEAPADAAPGDPEPADPGTGDPSPEQPPPPAIPPPPPREDPRATVSISGMVIQASASPDPDLPEGTVRVVGGPSVRWSGWRFELPSIPACAEVELELDHPALHPVRTAVLHTGNHGLRDVTLQTPDHWTWDFFVAMAGVEPEPGTCQVATTLTAANRFGQPPCHRCGEPGARAYLWPPPPGASAPVYFEAMDNGAIFPDPQLSETTRDGGVLFPNVPPGEYLLYGVKEGVAFLPARIRCEPDLFINASPPYGVQAIPPPDPPFVPPDDRLRASYAVRDLPVPLGISTGGYGQTPPPGAPRSPFQDVFQATTTLVQPPRAQVIHLVKGDRRLLLVTADLIAVFRTVHRRVADLVRQRTGLDCGDALVIAGNHSHVAPGRIFDTPLGPLFSDTYDEAIFLRVTGAIADAVVEALTAEAVPVRFGHAVAANAAMHVDRRCENPPLRDDTMHLWRFDRADGGGTLGLLVNYALHGTVFGWQQGVLGGDAPRAVEQKVQEAIPGGAPVLFFQSWTGDVGPADPRGDFPDSPWPEAPFPELDRLEAIGRSAAETVLGAWEAFAWEDDPDLGTSAAVAPMTWEAIGYAPGEWDHPAGAMLCGGGGSVCGAIPPVMDACLDLDWGWIPDTVRLAAFRLGPVAGVTLPGEPHTALGRDLLRRVAGAIPGVETWALFGYAQDYVGYLMLPDDWAGGGYEPGMAFLGPRQGEYLRDAAASVAARLGDPAAPLAFHPEVIPPWEPATSRPYVPSASVGPRTVVEDLPAVAAAGEPWTFRWHGGDPFVDRPEVVVERLEPDGTFHPLRAGGRVVDQRDYRVLLQVDPDPPWTEAAPGGRTFRWVARVRTAVRIPAPEQVFRGVFRLSVFGRAVLPEGTEAPYRLSSSPVSVIPEGG